MRWKVFAVNVIPILINLGNRQVMKLSYYKKFDFEVLENGCFICTSHTTVSKKTDKYSVPKIKRNKKYISMSRWIYMEMFGEIPDGLVVRHKCDNPRCINPEHLELGTQKQNIHDCLERGRFRRNANPKLFNEQGVKKVKELLKQGFSVQQVANLFNVSTEPIRKIKLNKY